MGALFSTQNLVEFNEEVIRTIRFVFPVQLNEKGREYKWKVTAISEFEKRSISEEFSQQWYVPPNSHKIYSQKNGTDNYPDASFNGKCEDPGWRLCLSTMFFLEQAG